jgi:DNA-binding protein Fis
MITVVFAKDEDRIRQKISDLLQKEGYSLPQQAISPDCINIMDGSSVSVTLAQKIAELGDELWRQKKADLYKSVLETIEKPLIEYVLERVEGNQLKAARVLGINRNTMRSKIKKLGIDARKWKVP